MTGGREWLRKLVTVFLLVLAVLAAHALWVRYQVQPLTRDGKVRADVIQIAPDVGGLVTEVRMRDNQEVRQGDLLLVIDRPRYQLALAQAEAAVDNQQAALTQALREDRRNRSMSRLVAAETIEQGGTKVAQLRMSLAQAVASRDVAKLNLERTEVRAPVDGVMTNVTLQPGIYLAAGKPAAALIYKDSIRVEGYFEETKLPAIHVGDPAEVRLMGVADVIRGHVESIAAGVEDRERNGSESMLANVNPSFTWVRLAQRIPVRIALDQVPPGVRTIVGRTATVEVFPRPGEVVINRSFPW